jgi:O-antigen/teichoic acid export membrane protein
VAGATIAQSLLSLVLSVLLARTLGPEGRGVYATATLVALLAGSLGTLGFEMTNVVTLARSPSLAPAALSASLLVAAICGAAGVLAVNASSAAGLLGNLDGDLIALASAAIPALILTSLLQGMLSGLGFVTRTYGLSLLGTALALLIVGGTTLLRPGDVKAAVGAFAAYSAVVSLFILTIVVRSTGAKLARPQAVLRTGSAFSLTSHAANVAHLLHLRVDIFLVNILLTSEDVGLYVLAQGLCEWIWLLPRAAGAVLFPSVASSEPQAAIVRTARTSRFTLTVGGLAALALGVSAGFLIPLLFGRRFEGSLTPLRILLPGVWLGSTTGVLSAYLTGRGQPRYPLVNALASLSANVGLNLALIPRAGILGAAAASAMTYALSAAINVSFVNRLGPLPLRELLPIKREEYLGLAQALLRLGRRSGTATDSGGGPRLSA